MFSKTLEKAALFGASTVASLAFTGTMMANSAQAATMSYRSEFSFTSNVLNSEVITGDFSFTKTEMGSDQFSYEFTDFNASISAFGVNESLPLDLLKANSDPLLALNEAFIPDEYKAILPGLLRGNLTGNGLIPENSTDTFTGQNFLAFTGELSNLLESDDFQEVASLVDVANFVFSEGGKFSIKTTTVPEPGTIFALGAVGVGLTATRRRRTKKKIKQKAAV